jgi:hypothetical protein
MTVTADERYRRWVDWMTRIENANLSLSLHGYSWDEHAAITQAAADDWKAPFRQPWLVERSGRLGD